MKVTAIVAAAAGIALSALEARAAFPASVATVMDSSVDPCEDFYQYSCGAWLKKAVIPPTEARLDYSFSTIGDRNDIAVEKILKEGLPLLGEFWDSCMNVRKLNELGAAPLREMLKAISATTTKQELFKYAGKLAIGGPNLFIDTAVDADEKDAATNVLNFGPGDLTLPDPSYYAAKAFAEHESAYRKYINTVLELAGFAPPKHHHHHHHHHHHRHHHRDHSHKAAASATLDTAANTVIGIEKKVVELRASAESDPRESGYHAIKFSDAAAKFPLTVGQFMEGMEVTKRSKLTGSSKVVFASLAFFEKLEALVASTSLQDLKTYVAFVHTSAGARYLSDKFYAAYFDFFMKALDGTKTQPPRDEICTDRAKKLFPDLVGNYYYAKMFDVQRENATKSMVELVEAAMGERIKGLQWIDAATKAEAAKKLAKVTNLIGHSLKKTLYPFALDREKHFENVKKINEYNADSQVKDIGTPVDRTDWEMGAAEVNAYYSPLENQMVFPAGILQPPMLDSSGHPAQNFGAVGFIVGHELTHGFDSGGRMFDGDGNHRNWWTKQASNEFDSRAQCFRDQYSRFVMLGENGSPIGTVNGNLTITENIADNGGLSLAYDVYQKYIKSPTAVVPAGAKSVSDEEANKLFFVSFGQTFCSKARDNYVKNMIKMDPHSPGQWRINGAVMNSDAFAKTFKCKAGAKMNPTKKCQLW
ncbi:hypothetical protein PybrP1_009727 [[Pythium] brassicae (nom. inval.)]|nr:hypothetical protein PybrP1_009727 [[Pythium] brassicae (nom. inval.)]